MPTPNPQPPTPVIAIFDFDHTLIEGDSFWKFLSLIAGWPRTIWAFIESIAVYAQRHLKNKNDPETADHRTFLKAQLLSRLVAGQPVSKIAAAAETLRGQTRWKESIRKALREHHEMGHHIVIASGGLDLYLMELLQELPHHGVICTQVGVKDGIVVGGMIAGNRVRLRKAELVAEYIARHGPFTESWGYGNLPHDLPMLELLKHRVVI